MEMTLLMDDMKIILQRSQNSSVISIIKSLSSFGLFFLCKPKRRHFSNDSHHPDWIITHDLRVFVIRSCLWNPLWAPSVCVMRGNSDVFATCRQQLFIAQQLLVAGMIPPRRDEAPFPFDGLSRWNFNTLCRVLFLAWFRDHANRERYPQSAFLSRSLKYNSDSMHFKYGILPM